MVPPTTSTPSIEPPSAIESYFRELPPEQLQAALADFLPHDAPVAERIRAVEEGLRSPLGQSLRDAMARWIVEQTIPVKKLVPEAYAKWRPPVRDAMMFVVSRLSPARLAPKLLEQMELPAKTSSEVRLLRLIAKVPGLQKLGQVLARNQHLRPALRTELAKLENGIRDVRPEDIRTIIENDLGPQLVTFAVKIEPAILSEGSVSAVVRFSWRDPGTGRRERGVFKVLKPHIPEYFAEDMDYLQGLAHFFASQYRNYGFPKHVIPDTFKKVRRLLQQEVNFVREQKTLLEAWTQYRSVSGVRVPRLIQPLCTPRITAMTAERGVKITNAAARQPAWRRKRMAEQLIEAYVAIPLFAAKEEAIFHGDPHAGNLLYDNKSGELTIIDWALRERLGREQRRHLALLFLMVGLRDPVGAYQEIVELSQGRIRSGSPRGQSLRDLVRSFLDELPITRLPSSVDAMRLLERAALMGIRFPPALILLSKVVFTLDGVLEDIGGSSTGMGFTIAGQFAQNWLTNWSAFRSPLNSADWMKLQCSALLYGSRVWVQGEQRMLRRLWSKASPPATPSS